MRRRPISTTAAAAACFLRPIGCFCVPTSVHVKRRTGRGSSPVRRRESFHSGRFERLEGPRRPLAHASRRRAYSLRCPRVEPVDRLLVLRPVRVPQRGVAHGAIRRREADRSPAEARRLPEGALGRHPRPVQGSVFGARDVKRRTARLSHERLSAVGPGRAMAPSVSALGSARPAPASYPARRAVRPQAPSGRGAKSRRQRGGSQARDSCCLSEG